MTEKTDEEKRRQVVTGSEALYNIGSWAAGQMGIDPNYVGRVVIDLNAQAIAKATFTVYWTEAAPEGLKKRLSRYTLTPLEGGA